MSVPKVTVEVGRRFVRGVVTDTGIRVGPRSLRGARLRCDCGTIYESSVYDLLNGRTRSCGCLMAEHSRESITLAHAVNTRHGLADHPLYRTWKNMLNRCENPDSHNYARYGGRDIRVCDRWHDVAVYIADIERWLGSRPQGMTLDRIFNDHDYRLDNMQYATAADQQQNRGTVKLTADMAREIRARWTRGGITQRALAAEYGVGQTRISYIVNFKTWAEPAKEIAGDLITLIG